MLFLGHEQETHMFVAQTMHWATDVVKYEHNHKIRIEVFQENIADNEYGHTTYNLSCHLGWSYFMTNLRSIYESGYDLRKKNKGIAEMSHMYTLKR